MKNDTKYMVIFDDYYVNNVDANYKTEFKAGETIFCNTNELFKFLRTFSDKEIMFTVFKLKEIYKVK